MMMNLLKQFCLLMIVMTMIDSHFLSFQNDRRRRRNVNKHRRRNVNKHRKRKNRKLKKSVNRSRIIDGDDRSYRNGIDPHLEKRELRFNLLQSIKSNNLNVNYKSDMFSDDYHYLQNLDNENEQESDNQNDEKVKD